MGRLYETFKTNEELEAQKGVVLDFTHFRVTILRAGGANKKYAKALDRKTKPLRRVIQNEQLDNDTANNLLRQLYAETVVVNWETNVDGEWVQGIEGPDGELLDFTRENVLMTFGNLP